MSTAVTPQFLKKIDVSLAVHQRNVQYDFISMSKSVVIEPHEHLKELGLLKVTASQKAT